MRIGSLLETGKGFMLDFEASPALQALASGWSGGLAYVAADAKERLGLVAALVRLDGVVAWACEAHWDLAGAAAPTARWFGEAKETEDRS